MQTITIPRRFRGPPNSGNGGYVCGLLALPKGLTICVLPSTAGSSAMASQRPQSRWTGKYPPGGPAEWIADGHVTCNIQCSGGKCDRRMVDVRLDTLPQNLPWSVVSRRLVCKQCGTAGSVHIVPNWHDRAGQAVPFTKHWKT